MTLTETPPVVQLAGGPGVTYPNNPPAGISLQLGALGIVLGLLSLAEANLLPTAAIGIVVPVAFSIGAVAIFAGGIINFRAGIMVAGVIGCLYGMFWLSLAILLQITASPLSASVGAVSFRHAFGWYLILWGVMSLGLCVPVYFVSKVVLAQQFVLSIVFFLLAAAFYGASTNLGKAGGWFGIIDSLLCFYISISLTTNETAGKTVLPLP